MRFTVSIMRYFKRFSSVLIYLIAWLFFRATAHRYYMQFFILYVRLRGAIVKGNPKYIGINCTLDFKGGIIFNEGVVISNEACLLTHDYSLNVLAKNYESNNQEIYKAEPIELGANCFVGKRAIVLPGITIGEGAVVAAGSVVTKNVKAKVIVAGNPARIIREIQ